VRPGRRRLKAGPNEDGGESCRPLARERQINTRFLAMTNPSVHEPEVCNPAAGWGKPVVRHWFKPNDGGQVEKNVPDARHQMLQGMPNVLGLAALNVWLEQRCMELWRVAPHGKQPPSR